MSPAHLAAQALLVFSWVLAAMWLWHAIAALRGMSTLPDLTFIDPHPLPPLPDTGGPHLTVIVPACNEESSIEATLRTLLASVDLRLEIIAVNDRSTDSTGQRMDRLAALTAATAGPHLLRVIHIHALPSGWLGKPHAMALAAREASASWLLFTDGDVVFDPHALSLALRHALAVKADHLVVAPTIVLNTWPETAIFGMMNALAGWAIRLWKVADPRASDAVGAGAFNLIRRDVYRSIGGFDAMPMEVVEDLRLGWLVKNHGYQQRFAIGHGLISVRWLQGTFGIVQVAEKNAFAAYRYRVGLTLLASLALGVQIVLPLLAFFLGGWGIAAGLLTWLSIALTYQSSRRSTRVSPWLAVFFAPAAAIALFALLRSMLLTLVRNGVEWRGTLYPLQQLRRNAGTIWGREPRSH